MNKLFGNRQNSGITLVALVITIVVLLILAGISIQMLKGDNGIIGKANEAKLESRAGDVEELVQLWKIKNENIKTKNELEGKNDALVSKEEMLENLKKEDKVFDNEIDTGREIIIIGTREIPYGEEVDKSALIMLVNSGDTGEVRLPLLETEEGRIIDWGDGKVTTAENKNTGEKKYASVIQNDGAKSKIVAALAPSLTHTYSEKNKEYIVTITGKCTGIYNGNDNILEIIQWGETGLERVCLEDCTKLRKIASPTEKSFEKITDFSYGFYGCESLTSIPEDLFANCPNVTTFEETFCYCKSLTSIPEKLFANCPNVTTFADTFYRCKSLTSIPENLFANCLNVTKFVGTFYECTGLTGEPIKLWERVPNGSANGYEGTPDGNRCYYHATGLNNYENIPEYWSYGEPM